MTQPYLIALDLDGTLLNSQKTIGDHTKKILKKCEALGHKLVIATGRPYRVSKDYYTELNLTTPIVNFNGASIHHPKNPEFKSIHSPIPKNIALSIFDICHQFRVKNILAEVLDEVFIETSDSDITDFFGMDQSDITIGPIRETLTTDPTCLLINIERSQIRHLLDALEKEHAQIVEQRAWGAPSEFIEINSRGTNKAKGLEHVASYLAIPKERILAFGDEENDLEMLREAAIGVAMGNARDLIKEAADYTTTTNDEEGIAHFLETRFLPGKL